MVWRATFIFCCFRVISEVANTPTSPAVDFNHTTDGELFIKELFNGQNASARPGLLSFTAPYKLCDGRRNPCRNDFAMFFPLYIGKYGGKYYKHIYSNDYDTALSLTVMLILFDMGGSKLRWDKWSWAIPQEPIEYFFRRHEQMPVKKPSLQCQCPPHEECTVQYKLNEDALHFLSIQGLISNSELPPSKETAELSSARTKRDVNGNVDEEPCCCSPRNIMMPAFISDKRFEEFVDRFDKKQNALRT